MASASQSETTLWFLRKPYQAALKSDWNQVIQFFDGKLDELKTAATGSGDTPLHLAVHSKKEQPLEQLLRLLKNLRNIDGLELCSIKNVYGNTLLHEAAITGNLEAAKLLMEKSQDLLIERNMFGETPLFRAAAFGHNEMVRLLAGEPGPSISDNQQLLRNPRVRDQDNTSILHIAIRGEHYETALLLLKLDKSLSDLKDPNSKTALHLLAETPSAFESGCSMGLLKHLLYHCLVVEEEEEDDDNDDDDDFIRRLEPEDIESGQIGKQSSHTSDCLKNSCKG